MERKLIAAAVSSALALPMAAQAVEFAVSGQINRAILSVDRGGDNDSVSHVDANSSQSRFRFKGSEELENGMTAGAYLEYGLSGNVRQANVSLGTAGGKLTLGHGSAAADNMAHADLGGPSFLGGVSNWCSYVSSGPACPSNDGGRRPVLRYDTPAIGPVGIAVSAGDDDYWDARLTIAGSFGDAGYDIRVGHIGKHDTAVTTPDAEAHPHETTMMADAGDVTTASAAVGFGQGTSIAVAWSQDNTENHEYQYVKLDHSYGDGSVGVYYKQGATDGGTEGSLWGLGVGHSLGGGVTAYAGYRIIEEDTVDDISFFLGGLRVSFN